MKLIILLENFSLSSEKMKFSLPRVATEDLFKKQRGTLGHILVEFREVKLCGLDPGFSLLGIIFSERRPATQPGKSRGIFMLTRHPSKQTNNSVNSENVHQVSIVVKSNCRMSKPYVIMEKT